MISFIKKLLQKEELDYADLMDRGALIIDVRTEREYAQRHAKGSINVPLSEVFRYSEKLKKQNKPIITCCRSGARSGNAAATLKSAGIEVYNGGSWNQVQQAFSSL